MSMSFVRSIFCDLSVIRINGVIVAGLEMVIGLYCRFDDALCDQSDG